MPVAKDYHITRGEVWERLIILKDRRSRRKRVPTEAAASILIDGTAYVIPTEITSEGGVKLYMNPNQTEWLADGEYRWDMVVTVSRSANLTSSPLAQTLAVEGTLTVVTEDNITPLDSDGVAEALAPVDGSYTAGGTVPTTIPKAYRGDSYILNLTFPDASYLTGAPANVLAQIKSDPDSAVVDATFVPTVSGNVLTLTIAEVTLAAGTYWTDVQVGTVTYLRKTKLVVEPDVSR